MDRKPAGRRSVVPTHKKSKRSNERLEKMSNLKVVETIPNQEELNQAVLSSKEAKAKIAFYTAMKKEADEKIIAAASQTKDGIIVTETYKITYSIFPVKTFDKEAAFAAHGDLLRAFEGSRIQTRLDVK